VNLGDIINTTIDFSLWRACPEVVEGEIKRED